MRAGQGTLIHAAYRRLNQLHLFSGGDPSKLHSHMMGKSLTALDVLPSAVHLTASMLSSSHPTERYQSTRTIVTQYGKTEDGGVSIGSLDLLASNGEVRPLISLHSGTAVTGTGSAQAADAVDMPQFSQDLVIMNPPFTSGGSDYTPGNPAGYTKKQFHGLGYRCRDAVENVRLGSQVWERHLRAWLCGDCVLVRCTCCDRMVKKRRSDRVGVTDDGVTGGLVGRRYAG